ncbi:MAG: acetate kinase [Eubacterium sp.]|nr:acetate kinase [Eubacterium sp.]
MEILVINCGSSSLKFQLIDSESEKVMAKGLCERIGIEGSCISYTPAGKDKITKEIPMPTHHEAIEAVMDFLTDGTVGVISDMSEVQAVGHRVVHGGEFFAESVLVNDEVLEQIAQCNDLAPLHNPANIIGIKACMEKMPGTPNVAVFDTAFHQTMPESAYLYAVPKKYYEDYKIRRYGFHGTSHSFVSKRTAELLGKDYNSVKTIVCHLGNGASICAVENGKSVDTSMGLTPLAGVIMGTRSGDIDPSIVEVIAGREGISVQEVLNILNKKSGVLGLSGISSDFRDINQAVAEGDEQAKKTFDAYIQSVVRFVGAYVAVMNGVDAIAITAGVGENNPNIRKAICEHLGYLGIEIDDAKNDSRGEEVEISTVDSKVKVFVVPTNEELAIARETVALAK